MSLCSIFANAVARRIACVLVALVLAWIGLGDARAQYENCFSLEEYEFLCPTREDAYLAARVSAHEAMQRDFGTPGFFVEYSYSCYLGWCTVIATVRQFVDGGYERYARRGWLQDSECPEGNYWDDETHTCGTPCKDKPPILRNEMSAPGPDASFCHGGCRYTGKGNCLGIVIDALERTYCDYWETAPGATCSVGELPAPIPPVTDSDGDGISDENDLSPNNPGVGNADGQEPSRACGGPGQPECLPDGSNEGSGRGNTSSGGGDCNTPPRSTGDAILAQIAFQTWATRCAITAAANQVGDGGSGTGPGTGDGDSALDQLRDEAAGLDTSLGEGDADDAWIDGPTSLDLDTGGLGVGGTCPAPPTINGVSIDPDGNLCMLVQIIGALVLVGAFAHAGYIIGRA